MIYTVYPRTMKLTLAQDVKACLSMDKKRPGQVVEVHVSMSELTADIIEAEKITGLIVFPDPHIFAPEIWLGREES
jgi:hypothetical protein